jgi:Zn-dependent protease
VSSGGWRPAAPASSGLSFSLFGNVVRIGSSFWLLTLVLALSGGNRDLIGVLGWLVVVTISVLWHELGHATVARLFGQTPVIDLHGMGGTTWWTPTRRLAWPERLAISLAGPAAGLIVGLVVYALWASGRVDPTSPAANRFIRDFLWVNIGWGVFNLLPILPLDGGGILAALLEGALGPRGLRVARWTSVVVGAGCALLAVRAGMTWAALILGLFAFNNFQALRLAPGPQA